MIGLDTNVLLRYILEDHPGQFARARRLIEEQSSVDEPAWISVVVAAELVWALRTTYGRGRNEIADTIERLLDVAEIRFEAEPLIEQALFLFRNGRADFPDALIALSNQWNGCHATVSFDKQLVRAGLAIEP